MNPARLLRHAERAIENVRVAPLPAAASASSIAVGLFLFGLFALTGSNLDRALRGWAHGGEPVTVYLERGLATEKIDSTRKEVEALAGVDGTTLVSPEEGYDELRRVLGAEGAILDGTDPEQVLPAVLLVRLAEEGLGGDAVERIRSAIAAIPGVADVDANVLWLRQYSRLRGVGWAILGGWGLLLTAGLLVVIANSSRLAAYTRRDEIEVLRLVGAPDGFIVAPFLVEGLLEGLAGAVLGVGGLLFAFLILLSAAEGSPLTVPVELRFLDGSTVLALFLAGPILGALGSGLSAWRFIREVEP